MASRHPVPGVLVVCERSESVNGQRAAGLGICLGNREENRRGFREGGVALRRGEQPDRIGKGESVWKQARRAESREDGVGGWRLEDRGWRIEARPVWGEEDEVKDRE